MSSVTGKRVEHGVWIGGNKDEGGDGAGVMLMKNIKCRDQLEKIREGRALLVERSMDDWGRLREREG
jgi:hypothetical protein